MTAVIVGLLVAWLLLSGAFIAALCLQYRREQRDVAFDAGHERAPWCCGVEHR